MIAFGFIYRTTRRQRSTATVRDMLAETSQRFIRAIWHLSVLLLPAMLYFASNVTAMHALSHLRSYIFTAIMNSRIVFAALLSMVLLRKSINAEQWRAITIVCCAASVLCLEDVQTSEGFSWTDETFGMFIALGAACVSSAGGVLVEKYLNHPTTALQSLVPPSDDKHEAAEPVIGGEDATTVAAGVAGPPDANTALILWEQQGVLALFSAVFAGLYVLLFLHDAVQSRRLLEGWTFMTAMVMLMQALQGILVAMTIQSCGIVFRLILGTISICLCIIIESLLFLEPVVFREVLSIVMVIVGSNMYSNASASAGPADDGKRGNSSSTVVPVLLHKEVAANWDEAYGGHPSAGNMTRITRRKCSPTPI